MLVILASLQTHHVYSTLRRRENDCFYVVSTRSTRGVFVGLVQTSRSENCKNLHINISKHSTALYFNNSVQVFCISVIDFSNWFVNKCFVFIVEFVCSKNSTIYKSLLSC